MLSYEGNHWHGGNVHPSLEAFFAAPLEQRGSMPGVFLGPDGTFFAAAAKRCIWRAGRDFSEAVLECAWKPAPPAPVPAKPKVA